MNDKIFSIYITFISLRNMVVIASFGTIVSHFQWQNIMEGWPMGPYMRWGIVTWLSFVFMVQKTGGQCRFISPIYALFNKTYPMKLWSFFSHYSIQHFCFKPSNWGYVYLCWRQKNKRKLKTNIWFKIEKKRCEIYII